MLRFFRVLRIGLAKKIYGNLRYAKKRGLICGKNVTTMGDVDFGSEPYLITLADYVRISFGVSFVTHDGGTWVFRHRDEYKNVVSFGKIYVGERSFIGAKSIIMPNVRIGKNCVIGAGSVVTKSIPDNSVAAGVPARVIATLDEYIQKKTERMDPTWDPIEYKRNKKKYLISKIEEPK